MITTPNDLSLSKRPLDLPHQLERIKWFLWHGNIFKALQTIEDVESDLEDLPEEQPLPEAIKLLKHLRDFQGYIKVNRAFIPNYGERYRAGEIISTAFVESTINHLVSKRFCKKQYMRWTKVGAHLLLQVRVQVLNDDWRKTFTRWYPAMKLAQPELPIAA